MKRKIKKNPHKLKLFCNCIPVFENSIGTDVGFSLKKVTFEGMETPVRMRVHRQPDGVWNEYRSKE